MDVQDTDNQELMQCGVPDKHQTYFNAIKPAQLNGKGLQGRKLSNLNAGDSIIINLR